MNMTSFWDTDTPDIGSTITLVSLRLLRLSELRMVRMEPLIKVMHTIRDHRAPSKPHVNKFHNLIMRTKRVAKTSMLEITLSTLKTYFAA